MKTGWEGAYFQLGWAGRLSATGRGAEGIGGGRNPPVYTRRRKRRREKQIRLYQSVLSKKTGKFSWSAQYNTTTTVNISTVKQYKNIIFNTYLTIIAGWLFDWFNVLVIQKLKTEPVNSWTQTHLFFKNKSFWMSGAQK